MAAPLPPEYTWLSREPAPRILLEALKLYGTTETPGRANTADILGWAKELGISRVYTADEIPWCGLFMGVCALRANIDVPNNELWALSWSAYGTPVKDPALGDVLVFTRKGGGHVGLYVGEDAQAYHVLGGNQHDKVSITRIAKARLYAARRTKWKVSQPPNVRRVWLTPNGTLSDNEA